MKASVPQHVSVATTSFSAVMEEPSHRLSSAVSMPFTIATLLAERWHTQVRQSHTPPPLWRAASSSVATWDIASPRPSLLSRRVSSFSTIMLRHHVSSSSVKPCLLHNLRCLVEPHLLHVATPKVSGCFFSNSVDVSSLFQDSKTK
ncbi:hypothetical protein S245_036724 [Arachis hypogaea]